ncbi:MAG: choice-of-anchor L domain-containing protein [Sulfurospirillum sp.]|nr:choice-of-anchor L domain-containing protein [Sulfurospirillum sp.]
MLFSASGATGIGSSTANWRDGLSATSLAQQIQGEGLTITNPTIKRGNSRQVGIFSNGISGAKLKIDEGIILTTMSVRESFTTNSSQRTSINNIDISADSDLLLIDNMARYDTVIFEFDVTLDANTRLLLIEYQFASEEYNEYVGSKYNDAFGFFLSGGDLNQTYNIARVVDDSVKMTTETIQNYPTVTINNVNNGSLGLMDDSTPQNLMNSNYFIDNVGNNHYLHPPISSPIDVEYDGITKKLQAVVDNLTPNITYHFKMALADTGDSSWDSGVFVNKIRGIREPSFCYDYSYSQNGEYFTEYNDGSKLPFIKGNILPNDDINVTIYLRNEEVSDVVAYNITMDITDINTTQAIYKRDTTSVLNTGKILTTQIPDTSMSVSDSKITDIPYDDLGSKSYAYLHYGLTPSNISNINMPINAQLHYDVEFDVGGGNTIQQHYDVNLTDNSTATGKIKICARDNARYEADWGIFNVVAKGIYDYPSSIKYNIPTQVVKRPTNLLVTAHDKDSLNFTKEVNSTTLVGIDLIDAGKFHNIKASCDDPSSAISPIIWMAFKNSSSIDLDYEIINAIADNRLELNSLEDYYQVARENTAYRISFITTNDGKESLIDTSLGSSPGFLKLNNLKELTKNITTCKQPVNKFSNRNTTTTKVNIACGTSKNKELSPFNYQRCMKCLFGYNTKHVCSRDNFSIRPESFNLKISDQNQTDKTQTLHFADDRTGVSTPNTDKIDIAVGYAYGFDINATSHKGNSATLGYTRYFNTTSTDHNISFIWNSDKNSTVCNDISSQPLIFNMIDGVAKGEVNATNVGVYRLNIIDKGWTKIDQAPIMHHEGIKSSYFIQGDDCLVDSSVVQNTNINPSISNNVLNDINGCDIDTNNHNNSDANLKYRDYNVTIHPYAFDLSSMIFSTRASNILNSSFIYIANLDHNKSNNMSFNSNGFIKPIGFNNIVPSNYVADCYANDINIFMNGIIELNTTSYLARFIDFNSTGQVMDYFVTDINNSVDNNFTLLSISKKNFRKDYNGIMHVDIAMNYKRDITIPINPLMVEFKKIDINCRKDLDCQMNANFKTDYATRGTNDFNDINITHYYGRVHAPDYQFEGSFGDANIMYEVYCKNCNKNIYNISNLESPDSIYWYQNIDHNNTIDGNVPVAEFNSVGASIVITDKNPINNGVQKNKFTSISTPTTPNKDRIQMRPSPWLLYNRFNATALTNDFDVEFYSKGSSWAGKGNIGNTVDINISVIQNKRLNW